MALVTTADLSTFMNTNFSTDELARAGIIITGVQAIMETILNRKVETGSVVDEEHLISDPDTEKIFVKNTPVSDVTSLSVDDVEQNANDYTVYSWGVAYALVISSPVPPFPLPVVKISYNYIVPDSSTETCRYLMYKACAREMNLGAQSLWGATEVETDGGYRVTLEQNPFTESEIKTLSRYRRRIAFK